MGYVPVLLRNPIFCDYYAPSPLDPRLTFIKYFQLSNLIPCCSYILSIIQKEYISVTHILIAVQVYVLVTALYCLVNITSSQTKRKSILMIHCNSLDGIFKSFGEACRCYKMFL